jgi:hypothetical protein
MFTRSRSRKTIDKIPVKAWLADALFKATAVVPIKNVLLPKTAAEIVPVKLAAVRDVSAAPFPENLLLIKYQ